MKIDFRYEEKDGKSWLKGWDLVAETAEESEQLATIRDATFFGLVDKGTYPKYDGREALPDHPDWPIGKLLYTIPNPQVYKKD